MKLCIALLCFVLVSVSARSTPDEESVVSNYTSSSKLDIYQQIATNIAQRITSPIYRFFGIEAKNKTQPQQSSPKRNFDHIELFDDPEATKSTNPLNPVNNDISVTRDVEELSVDAQKKLDRKPEKVTLYNYLPAKAELVANDTDNEVDGVINEVNSTADDDFDFDFDDDEEPREGAVYFLEWIGSIIQLAWGAFVALFRPNGGS